MPLFQYTSAHDKCFWRNLIAASVAFCGVHASSVSRPMVHLFRDFPHIPPFAVFQALHSDHL